MAVGCGSTVSGGAGGAGSGRGAGGSDDATGGSFGGSAGGVGGLGGTGGGGESQIPSSQASTADECKFYGLGGAEAVYCDYVTVEFSQALPMPGVVVEVDTSFGDHLTVATASSPHLHTRASMSRWTIGAGREPPRR